MAWKRLCAAAAASILSSWAAAAAPPAVGAQYNVAGGNGARIAVYEWGNKAGPPILFIHGVDQSHLIWNHQYDSALAKDFRLIAFDLRGQGESEKPLSLDAYEAGPVADDVAAVIRELQIKKPVIVAWSAGGFTLCDYLRKYGDGDLAGINFIAVSTKRGTPSAAPLKGVGSSTGASAAWLQSSRSEEMIAATMDFVRSMAAKPLPPEEFTRIVALNMLTPLSTRPLLSARVVDNGDVLAKIKVPTNLYYGAKDVVVNPKTASEYVNGAVTGSKLSIYEDAGHLLFIDDADRYNNDLRDFVLRVNNKQG